MNEKSIDKPQAEAPAIRSENRDAAFLLRILASAYLRKAGAKVECVAKSVEKRDSGLD